MKPRFHKKFHTICALILSILTVIAMLPAASPSIFPKEAQAAGEPLLPGGPALQSKAAVVMEVHSGAVLYAKNATSKEAPISLTKLMTCLLALEKGNMTDSVPCSYTSIHGIGTKVTRVGLVYEERMSLKDMLYAILVASADEATYAVGEYLDGGKESKCITMMNERATALGCIGTNFTNTYGAAKENHYSCAYDLALIASELCKFPLFYQIAGSKWYELPATNKNAARVIAQTHAFIRQTKKYDYATAGKTGGSGDDGYALCTFAEKNGMQLVSIVLGSPDNDTAYDDSIAILNYGFENYKVYDLKAAESQMSDTYNALFGSCPMFSYGDGEMVYINDNASLVLPVGGDISRVTKTIEYYGLPEYVHGENAIGAVLYQYDGLQVGKSQIIFNNPEFPISQEEFDAIWPKFLIPPANLASQGGDHTVKPGTNENGSPKPESKPISKEEKAEQKAINAKNRQAKFLAAAIFSLLFFTSLVIIYITIPSKMRRKRRRRAMH